MVSRVFFRKYWKNDLIFKAFRLRLDEQVHVFYVDFGNHEALNVRHIRKLDEKFCDLEFLAFPASLANVSDSSDKNLLEIPASHLFLIKGTSAKW